MLASRSCPYRGRCRWAAPGALVCIHAWPPDWRHSTTRATLSFGTARRRSPRSVFASMTWKKPGLIRSISPPVTSRTVCTNTCDGNGEPPPRSRRPGAHRAPSWSSCKPPCFHLPGRGSKEARRKHVMTRPSGPCAARRSSSVAGAPCREGAVRAAIGCRNTSRSPREPLSRFGRLAAAIRIHCHAGLAVSRTRWGGCRRLRRALGPHGGGRPVVRHTPSRTCRAPDGPAVSHGSRAASERLLPPPLPRPAVTRTDTESPSLRLVAATPDVDAGPPQRSQVLGGRRHVEQRAPRRRGALNTREVGQVLSLSVPVRPCDHDGQRIRSLQAPSIIHDRAPLIAVSMSVLAARSSPSRAPM